VVDAADGLRRGVHAPARHHRAVASLLAGLAPDPTFLNLSRAVQGVGGAILFAVSLALIAQEFPAGRERGIPGRRDWVSSCGDQPARGR
jgi:MFS family permease